MSQTPVKGRMMESGDGELGKSSALELVHFSTLQEDRDQDRLFIVALLVPGMD